MLKGDTMKPGKENLKENPKENLRKEVLKTNHERAQVQASKEKKSGFNGAQWHAALKAFSKGYKPPVPRFPVVLNPSGPIADAKQLQELLDLPEPPEVVDTYEILVEDDPNDQGNDQGKRVGYVVKKRPVRVAVILGWALGHQLEETTKWEMALIWFEGEQRDAHNVYSIEKPASQPDSGA